MCVCVLNFIRLYLSERKKKAGFKLLLQGFICFSWESIGVLEEGELDFMWDFNVFSGFPSILWELIGKPTGPRKSKKTLNKEYA